MLSTQLSSISKASATTRIFSTTPAVISCSGGLPTRLRPYQQTRAFRLGLWSSYLDETFQKEIRRRQRLLRHKYAAALNRSISWDRHYPMHIKHNGLKSFMCSAWRGNGSRRGPWVSVEPDSTEGQSQPSGQTKDKGKTAQGIEEQNLYHWLDSHHRVFQAKARMFPGWTLRHSMSQASQADSGFNPTSTEDMSASSKTYGSEGFRRRFQGHEPVLEDQLDHIDPITNRRIPKKSEQPRQPQDSRQETFEEYRSQFQKLEPLSTQSEDVKAESSISSKEPHPQSNAKQYASTHTTEETFEGYLAQIQKMRPSFRQGISAAAESTSQEPHPRSDANQNVSAPNPKISSAPFNPSNEVDPLLKYDEKCGFKSGRQYDTSQTDIDYSCPVQQGLRAFDDKITSPASNEASSSKHTPKHSVQDGLEAFDRKAEYGGREVFGSAYDEALKSNPVQDAIDNYQAAKQFVRSRIVYPEKPKDQDTVLKAKREYENSAPRKEYLRDQQADELVISIKNYEDMVRSERVKDMEVKVASSDPLLKAIDKYKRAEANKETDTLLASNQMPTDPLLRAIREYKISVISDVRALDQVAVRAVKSEVVDPLLKTIDEYERSLFQNSSQQAGQQSANSTERYLEEFDKKVGFYQRPSEYSDPELTGGSQSASKISPEDSTKSEAIPKSWAYLPEKIRELFAKEAHLETETGGNEGTKNNDGCEDVLLKESKAEQQARHQRLQADFAKFNTSCEHQTPSAEALRWQNSSLKAEHQELQKEVARLDKMVDSKIVHLEKEFQTFAPKMTGNYVRDFPEEFKASWTSGPNSEVLTRKDMSDHQLEANIQNNERAFINGVGAREAYSRKPNASRLEPSLDRAIPRAVDSKVPENETIVAKPNLAEQAEGDLSSSVLAFASPQGDGPNLSTHAANVSKQKLKNSQKEVDRQLVREVRSIYEDTYGTIDSKHRQVPRIATAAEPIVQNDPASEADADKVQPTLYKILAYDPTMQSISTAETTSIVADASGPLTPAEVLLRLSNPAKFFPHFEPLQKQGYEIVSGSGDVLVFRKVREGTLAVLEQENAAKAKESFERRKIGMNPIDGMMRGPATGDYASPTGFVNYDIPRGSEPPFKSNIDVRREEPVFSGKRNWQDGSEDGGRKKTGMKTVLIGAGWLAGCSYAIGVVSDYFKTGGTDGQGPTGF